MKKVRLSLRNNAAVATLRIRIRPLLPLLIFLSMISVIPISYAAKQSTLDAAKNARKIASLCSIAEHHDVCLAEQFTFFSKTHAVSETLKVLHEIKSFDSMQPGCHFIAHIIAADAVQKNDGDWRKALSELPLNDCTGGFIMGVFEGYKKFNPAISLNAAKALEICKSNNNRVRGKNNAETCMHTIGHLFLVEKEGNIGSAVTECSHLPPEFTSSCYNGLFMENLYRRNLADHEVSRIMSWNEETFQQQRELCSEFNAAVAQSCWRELSHMIIGISHQDRRNIAVLCSSAPDPHFSAACKKHAEEISALLSTD
jgi:hypothetical protein